MQMKGTKRTINKYVSVGSEVVFGLFFEMHKIGNVGIKGLCKKIIQSKQLF